MPRNKRRKPKVKRKPQVQRVIVNPGKTPMGKPKIIGEVK